MTNIDIQVATLDQAHQILSVLVDAFEQYRGLLDPPSGVFHETADNIQQKLALGGGFVANDGLQMVGVVLYQPHPDFMYFGRLGVLPAYRGHQIATRLCTQVEQTALERQLRRVQLGVRIGLTENQQFFQHLGYRIVSYHTHEHYTEYTYVLMEKELIP